MAVCVMLGESGRVGCICPAVIVNDVGAMLTVGCIGTVGYVCGERRPGAPAFGRSHPDPSVCASFISFLVMLLLLGVELFSCAFHVRGV